MRNRDRNSEITYQNCELDCHESKVFSEQSATETIMMSPSASNFTVPSYKFMSETECWYSSLQSAYRNHEQMLNFERSQLGRRHTPIESSILELTQGNAEIVKDFDLSLAVFIFIILHNLFVDS